jgi:oligoribonuclease NrnB/cAMP/cGMP phosphodiesterase (DHH superfamily)
MSKTVIGIYHSYNGYTCIDGIAAAWAFAKYMKEKGKPYKLMPGVYGQDIKFDGRTFKDAEVFFLDYTIPRDQMIDLAKVAKKITIIDHHESAQKNLVDLPTNVKVHFELENSGAVLTWRHFFPDEKEGLLLRYIEDIDLNKYEIDFSDEIALFFRTLIIEAPEDFQEALDSFNEDIVTQAYIESEHKWIKKGSTIKQYVKFLVDTMSERSFGVEIDGHKALKVNCEPTLFVSVGNQIIKSTDYKLVHLWAEIKNIHGNPVVQNSLRSDGEISCHEIASKRGGGGHQFGAGFFTSLTNEMDKRSTKAIEKAKTKIQNTLEDLEKDLT